MWRRRRTVDDFSEEIKAHLALETDRLVGEGLSRAEAGALARRRFGSVAAAQERFYESRRLLWLDHLRQDVRYALRTFRRNPAFTCVAVLTLALGIGANTAIFSVVNAVLLQEPYEGANRVVGIGGALPAPGLQREEVAAIGARSRTLSHIGVYFPITRPMTLGGQAEPVRLNGIEITPSILAMVGARPLLGRLFDPRNDADSARVVVLSHEIWQRYFGGNPDLVGRIVPLDGAGYTVVGVMPAGFAFPDARAQFWMPLAWPRGARLIPTARLREGVTIEAANAELNDIMREIRQQEPPAAMPVPPGAPRGFQLFAVRANETSEVKGPLLVLAAAVGFVLLIACVNVGNLLLARGVSRRHEIAIRRALGADGGRLVRQALIESLLLAAAGGAAGMVIAVAGTRLLQTLGAGLSRGDGPGAAIPRLEAMSIDRSVVAFTLSVSVATGLLLQLIPALHRSAFGALDTFRQGSSPAVSGFHAPRRNRAQGLLVVAEVAMAMILPVGGGLLIHSFVKLTNVAPGYAPTNVLTFEVGLPESRYLPTLPEEVVARVQSIGGVRSAGYTRQLPTVYFTSALAVTLSNSPIAPVLGPPPPPPNVPRPPDHPDGRVVSRDYFNAMGIPIIAGRAFGEGDRAGARQVLVINRSLARSGFFGDHPLGSQVYALGSIPWEVVGIVEDTRHFLDAPASPQVFFDRRQLPRPAGPGQRQPPFMPYYVVRADGDSGGLVSSIQAAVRQMDSQAIVENVASMNQLLSASVARPRLFAVLLGLFAGVAATLSAIGIYGVMAYSITQRTREIGIRIALGARRSHVLILVLRQVIVLTTIGIGFGLAGAAMITRYLNTMLFGLSPLDAATFVAVSIAFALVAALAAFVPARRAMHVDPLIALRCE